MTKQDLDRIIRDIGDRTPLIERLDVDHEVVSSTLDIEALPQAYPGKVVDVSRAKANVVRDSTEAILTLNSFVGA